MAEKRDWFKRISPDVLCFGTMFILLIIALSVLGYHWYEVNSIPKKSKSPQFFEVSNVEWGDFVEVQYTAWFADTSPEVVFDTTYESIANDESVPKADSFDVTKFEPKRIYIGDERAPPGPDNEVYTTVPNIPVGLRDGLIGMKKGETKVIIVPPEKGYSRFVEETLDLYMEIPRYFTMDSENFTTKYAMSPVINLNVSSSDWGWPIIVVAIDGNNVTLLNDPVVGFTWKYESWNFTVESKNATTIVIRHIVESGMDITYKGYKGIVKWVDTESFRISYDTSNDPRAGHTLKYEVKVIKILREKKD